MIGNMLILIGIMIGLVGPTLLPCYQHASLVFCYDKMYVFNLTGWVFVFLGLCINSLMYVNRGKQT